MLTIPLPSFSWASGAEVWGSMLEKDAYYAKLHNQHMLNRHPALADTYRTILFDWLSEVSQECKFHRETYHLALDFIDRYLAAQSNVGKLQLQLIGTTCLFAASKFEEIRPPTVQEFADLTDGACKADDILDMEINILSAINWDITPITPNSWLNVYMQILLSLDEQSGTKETDPESKIKSPERKRQPKSNMTTCIRSPIHCSNTPNKCAPQPTPPATPLISDENSQSSDSKSFEREQETCDDSFMLPKTNGFLMYSHKRIASVIDLALLHIESLRFSNSILTASALYHFTDEPTTRQCTGYRKQDLNECIEWLRPFVETIKDVEDPVFIVSCRGQNYPTQMHSHIATASLLEKVTSKVELSRQSSLKRKACTMVEEEISHSETDSVLASPIKQTTVLLTPPSSTRKARKMHKR